jgi:hypothetical protein
MLRFGRVDDDAMEFKAAPARSTPMRRPNRLLAADHD